MHLDKTICLDNAFLQLISHNSLLQNIQMQKKRLKKRSQKINYLFNNYPNQSWLR